MPFSPKFITRSSDLCLFSGLYRGTHWTGLGPLPLKHPKPPESVTHGLHSLLHTPAFAPNKSPGSVALITQPPGQELLTQPMV
jgi:hypothetical protein